jgi:YidC/Oxa1 family membrane protein insertase
MTELQPKMKELQKKYANDKQKLNQKVMELYSTEKVSPYSGCLPIIIQLPILWAFYRTLYNFPYGNDSSIWFLGFDITKSYGFEISYHLALPILAAVTTYLMTKVSTATNPNAKASAPSGAEQSQKFMLIFMPFFLAYIVVTVPSGLGLYIITMNVMSILQTIYINRKLTAEKEREKAV